MSWRSNSQRTGANEAPLANQRRWGGGGGGPPPASGGGGGGGFDYSIPSSSYGNNGGPPPSNYGGGGYGGGGPPPPTQLAGVPGGSAAGEPRKRKSRWGDEKDKIQMAGMPTAISGDIAGKDLENYATHVRLDEIGRKLRSGDVVPPERERSPSPPPTYDHHGRRTNTREIRYRRKLEDERNRLVERAIKNDPNYRPPTEYLVQKRQTGRPSEKVYIPVKEFPEIKWIGLILGPRGNSLKNMERDSGAKIVIRGKGSTKEGKQAFGTRSQDEDDELHCNVTADSEEKVQACVKLINKVIATAASTPDEQNEHKRHQLRELAMLNGTLRDDENQPCQNCGKVGHRKWDCPEERNFTANVVCRNCGNMGHMARDCIAHRNRAGGPGSGAPGGAGAQQFDSEYSALMAELGESNPLAAITAGAGSPSVGGPGGAGDAGHAGGPVGKPPPPWRISSNWMPPQPPRERHDFNGGPRGGYTQFNGGAGGGYGGAAAGGYGGGYGAAQSSGYDYSASGYGAQQGYGAAAGGAQGYGAPQGGYQYGQVY